MATITVLLAEDFIPFRAWTRSLLDQCPSLRVVGEVSDGLAAVEKAQELKPDLILMDIGLPQLHGLEAARRIRNLAPSSKIVFLSQEEDPDLVTEGFNVGACGYVIKQQAQTELSRVLASIFETEPFASAAKISLNLA